ncbi:MAG: hypothetical protein RJA98_587 [Pseudomonadota bacterium]|jgi:diguanylate cyclase
MQQPQSQLMRATPARRPAHQREQRPPQGTDQGKNIVVVEGTAVRYRDSKEKTAEILRLALAGMGRQPAILSPITFTVWYEHVAGINPPLSDDIQQRLQQTQPIDDDAVHTLYRLHIADLDPNEADRISNDFQRLMSEMADSAARTGQTAGAFSAQLSDLSTALAPGATNANTAPLSHHLEAARQGTAQMKDSVKALQDQVTTNRLEINRLQAELKRALEEGLTCPLSGVLNRKGFNQELQTLLQSAPGDAGTRPCLVLLDIDHFKAVNDTHGHLVGDRVIEGLGLILKNAAAEAGATAARYGGEEFALVMRVRGPQDALALAQRVCERTRALRIRHRSTQAVLTTITVSGGVAMHQPGEDAQALIARADAALYRSKQTGRDRVTVAA